MKDIRQSNIELLRLVSMMLLVMLHANFYCLGNITPGDVSVQPGTSMLRIFMEMLCAVCVNVFVLISGWFGIKPRFKGAVSLIFQVWFLAFIVVVALIPFGLTIHKSHMIDIALFGSYYWFVPAYLLLYILAPALNAFIEHCSRPSVLIVIISFFVAQTVYGYIRYVGAFEAGYSTISFIGLYLLARYLNVYSVRWTKFSAKKDIALYLLFSILSASLYYFGVQYGITFLWETSLNYNTPFLILASVFFMLAFTRMSFQNKSVNWLAGSSFAIYLIHMHPMVKPHFKELMQQLFASVSCSMYFLCAIGIAIVVGILCILIDKIRVLTWNGICKWFLDDLLIKVETKLEIGTK